MLTDPTRGLDAADIGRAAREFVAETAFATENSSRTGEPGYDEKLWKLMTELGFCGVAVEQVASGLGLGYVGLGEVLRETGGRVLPSPLLATAGFAVAALRLAAVTEKTVALLTAIADGSVTATVAGLHENFSTTPTLTAHEVAGGNWTISGTVDYVIDGDSADLILVVAATDGGPRLLVADGSDDSITTTSLGIVDTSRRYATVRFDNTVVVAVGEVNPGRVADICSALLAAESLGGATHCFATTVDYLHTREQFGRPIGTFQALKHRCAELAVSLTTARELAFAAADDADRGRWSELAMSAPMALNASLGTSLRAGEEGIQLHGGIGFTEEAGIGRHYRRAIADRHVIGGTEALRDRLHDIARMAGA